MENYSFLCQKIAEIKDHFDKFRKSRRRLTLGLGKLTKVMEKVIERNGILRAQNSTNSVMFWESHTQECLIDTVDTTLTNLVIEWSVGWLYNLCLPRLVVNGDADNWADIGSCQLTALNNSYPDLIGTKTSWIEIMITFERSFINITWKWSFCK